MTYPVNRVWALIALLAGCLLTPPTLVHARSIATLRDPNEGMSISAEHWAYDLCQALVEKELLPDYEADYFKARGTRTDKDFANATVRVFDNWRECRALLRQRYADTDEDQHLWFSQNLPLWARDYEQLVWREETLEAPAKALFFEFNDYLIPVVIESTDGYTGAGDLAWLQHFDAAPSYLMEGLFPGLIGDDPVEHQANDATYEEVPADDPAYTLMRRLIDMGLLEGYPEHYFDGSRLLTRYEFAQGIARALDSVDYWVDERAGEAQRLVLELKHQFREELDDY